MWLRCSAHSEQETYCVYASRVLTETENRYAQIEKELLVVTFGLERFHQYIFGIDDVSMENNHKPLEGILKKNIISITA
jgi:hypothetical protein